MFARWRLSIPILSLAVVGCGGQSVVKYTDNPKLRSEIGDDRPGLQQLVRAAVLEQFGPTPSRLKVPEGVEFRAGGAYLARYFLEPGSEEAKSLAAGAVPAKALAMAEAGPNGNVKIAGGYALWRKHCLHCHGVQGDGNGPTADFLVPHPRDLREGKFKFTSTPSQSKPTRADLHRTIKEGLHGSSMPSFDALMTEDEIQQVLDYTIFLSVRGEAEVKLIQNAKQLAESLEAGQDVPAGKTLDELFSDGGFPSVAETIVQIGSDWTTAEAASGLPTVARTPPSDSSVIAGRNLFLNGQKLQCLGCHGVKADGTGASYIDRDIYNDVVFREHTFHRAVTGRFLKARNQKLQAEGHGHGHSAKAGEPADVAAYLKSSPVVVKYLFNPERWTKHPVADGDAPFGLATGEDVKAFGEFRKQLDSEEGAKALAAKAKELIPLIDDAEFQAFFRENITTLWVASHDEWGNPLRPANLNLGVYRGGRRPLDIYLRIANGINGSKMPQHGSVLQPAEIWDLVNFVLALPSRPELLDVPAAPTAPHSAPAAPVAANN